jgi:DnaJ-class molecular chaperone
MYVEPRRVPYDADLGAYTGHPMDPRYDGPSECPECGGGKRNPAGDPCEWCGGTGHYWENDE